MNFEREKAINSLLSNSITSIAQDNTGFLWLGTDYGLARFDGYNYVSFYASDENTFSLPSNIIKRIIKNKDGNIWVGTDRGIAYVDTKTGEIIQPEFCRQYNMLSVNTISEDTYGNLWLGTNDGVKVINPDLKKAKSINANLNNNESYNVNFIEIDINGNIWIASNFGFCAIKKISTQALFSSQKIEGKYIFERNRLGYFKIDSNNTLWLSNNDKNYIFDISSDLKLINKTTLNKNIDGKSIIILQNKNVLIGSRWNGISEIETTSSGKDIKSISQIWMNSQSTTDLTNTVNALYEDNSGNTWAGTKAGLYVSRKTDTSLFHNIKADESNPKSLLHNTISTIMETNDGNLWIGTTNGLNQLVLSNGMITSSPEFKRYNPSSLFTEIPSAELAIQCIIEDQNNELWIGTKQGVVFFDPVKKTFFRKEKINSFINQNNITLTKTFFKDLKNNIWMGFTYGGLVYYSKDRDEYSQIDYFKSSDVWCITQDHTGNMWIGTHNGLYRFNSNIHLSQISSNVTAYKHKSGDVKTIPANWVTSLITQSNGNILVGTSEGLCRYNIETDDFSQVEYEENNHPPYISGITEDLKGNLWISTPSGVYRKDPKKNTEYFELAEGNFSSINYTYGHLTTEAGQVLLGGTSGLFYFNPDEIIPDSTSQTVYFSQLLLPNRSFGSKYININDLQKITLPHYEKQFSVLFSTLSYAPQSRIKYSYRIKEVSNEWIYLDGANSVSFSNQPKGRYTLEVRSTTASGFWQKNPSSIQIIVLPPWWKTTIAYLIYFILFILSIFGIISWFRSRDKLLRASELSQYKLVFYTNLLHSFRGPLSLMQSPLNNLIKNHKKMRTDEIDEMLNFMQRNSKRLSHMMMQLLEFRKIDRGKLSLNLSENDIISLLNDVYYSFMELADSKQINFTLNSSVNSQILIFDFEKIEIVLFNLLSNAFKFTEKGGSVNIDAAISHDGNDFIISIKDNGFGIAAENKEKIFERFWQVYQEDPAITKGTGIGLSLAKDFVEAHHGKIKVESELNQGSNFTISLPLGKKHYENYQIAEYEKSSVKRAENVAHYVEIESEISLPEIEDQDDVNKHTTIFILSGNKETLNFLFTTLSKEHHISLLNSAEKLLDKIEVYYPTLVITELSIENSPVGLNLCKKIKGNPATSHIPCILLADISNEDEKLTAYEAGADAYIEKPIDVSLLQVRIGQILRMRDEIKEKTHHEIMTNPHIVSSTSQNTKFLQEVMTVIEENMDDEFFTLDEFATCMKMSRSKLNSRMISLTQQTPIEFVRNVRLKRAAQLLKLDAYSISEISFMVGISDPRYFSTIFKKQYGMSPLQYAKQEKDKISKEKSEGAGQKNS